MCQSAGVRVCVCVAVCMCVCVCLCLWATGHVLGWKHNEADWTEWAAMQTGSIVGPKRRQKPLKSASLIYAPGVGGE